ncbi:MAG TPA: hypothetical protein VKO42_01565 [Patescibacteria group bacterium]|nr:hypothetical protein [Patescibacteria group bacterium]
MGNNNRYFMKITFSKIIWFLFYVFLFSLFLYNSFSYLDPDLGWHLRVGQEVWQEQAVPHINHYNYSWEGVRWVDHEWLLDAFSFGVYDHFGYIALSFVFALLVTLALAIWHRFIQTRMLKKSQGAFFFIIFLLWGAFAMRPHVGVRMQEITLLLLVFLLIIIYYYNKNKNIKPLLFLPPLFYFWTCVHGGFLIGFFILFFFIGVKLVELVVYKKFSWKFLDFKQVLSLKYIAIFALFSLISLVATFFTPYGLELYSFLGGYTNTYYMTHISEWLGQHYLPLHYWQLVYLSTSGAVLCLFLFFSFSGKNRDFKLDLWQVGLFAVFFLLAFKSRRHFPLFFLVSLPLMIYFLVKFFDIKRNILEFKFSSVWLSRLIRGCLVLSLVAATTSVALATRFTDKPFQSYCRSYPCGAVQFLKDNPRYDDKNIFNKYSWGGYLIWTYPERKIFVDGRLPQYEFGDHTILEEYFDFFEQDKAQENLEEHDIGLVLLPVESGPLQVDWFERYFLGINPNELENKDNHLREYLQGKASWKQIYKDEVGLIYFKTH